MNSKIRSKICCLIEFFIYRVLQTANGYVKRGLIHMKFSMTGQGKGDL
jgi:hypothetical protein